MIPFINNSSESLLSIPELSGGMNLRDGLSLVRDDQLTDCKNMWYRDGMLKTRPRVRFAAGVDAADAFKSFDQNASVVTKMHEDIKFIENGEVYYLVVSYGKLTSETGSVGTLFEFRLMNETNPQDVIKIGRYWFGENKNISHFCFKRDDDIYLFYLDKDSDEDSDKDYGILRLSKRSTLKKSWAIEIITKNDFEEKLEIPVIATDGLPPVDDLVGEFNGTVLKPYNLLCPYYTVEYSTVNTSVDSNPMRYPILYPIKRSSENDDTWSGMVGKYVTAEYVDINGNTYCHKAVIRMFSSEKDVGADEGYGSDGTQITDAYTAGDGLAVHAWRNQVFFTETEWTPGAAAAKQIRKSAYLWNNLKITMPVPNYEENIVKLFNMTKSVRYGGQGSGDGGSRLFLTGNTIESEKSLVMWSALDDPLYFPQNAYVYVGDKGQEVTAFGKMAGGLFAFKEKEVHMMDYSKGDTSVDNGNIPTMLINDKIGCDCPDTVQLCRNRLVWADSHGKVYSLVSQNQNNEHNVFEVSEMVERKLKCETELKNAHSADYMGHYILSVGNRMYVMDYNSYGYNYVSSYSKAEDANLLIPWYYWEIGVTPVSMVAANDVLTMSEVSSVGWDENGCAHFICDNYYFDGSYGNDEYERLKVERTVNGDNYTAVVEGCEIPCFVQTKLFDFGQPSRKKTVAAVDISFGYNDGRSITVNFISERGIPDEHTLAIGAAEAEIYSPDYVHSCRFYPYTNAAVMFGVRVSCEGEMAIDSLSLKCRRLRW